MAGRLAGRRFAPFTTRSPLDTWVRVDIQRDTAITEDIDEELKDQPQLVAWYSQLYSEAKLDLDFAEAAVESTYEDLLAEVLDGPLEGMPRAAASRDKWLKSQVLRDARYRAAVQERIAAQYRVNQLSGCLKALEERHWSLQSLGAGRRQEQRSGLRDHTTEES